MGYFTALFATIVRLARASQGVHVSPSGYIRELAGELQRSHRRRDRSRRVRRYAERVPAPTHAPAATGRGPQPNADGVGAPAPPRVPARRSPSVTQPAANVSVPAAIVRGRCFVSGRATGARPIEGRALALAVLCALAGQECGQASGAVRSRSRGLRWAQQLPVPARLAPDRVHSEPVVHGSVGFMAGPWKQAMQGPPSSEGAGGSDPALGLFLLQEAA